MAAEKNKRVGVSIPPRPISKPGTVKVARALYKYTAQHDDELSFEEGDVLYVYESVDENWWKAKCNEKSGLIPAIYVEEQAQEIQLPLHEAARRGNLSFLKECLDEGVSETGLDSAGNTPLHWAARAGHVDCVEQLLSVSKSPVNSSNRMGDTPLHLAANHRHLEVVNLLLSAGSDVNLTNDSGAKAEDLASDFAVKNAIQMTQRDCNGSNKYAYVDNDYDDESD